jgi:hypothetical protein
MMITIGRCRNRTTRIVQTRSAWRVAVRST